MKIPHCNVHIGSFLAGGFGPNAFLVICNQGNEKREHRSSIWFGDPSSITSDKSGFVNRKFGLPAGTWEPMLLVSDIRFTSAGDTSFRELSHHGFYSMSNWVTDRREHITVIYPRP